MLSCHTSLTILWSLQDYCNLLILRIAAAQSCQPDLSHRLTGLRLGLGSCPTKLISAQGKCDHTAEVPFSIAGPTEEAQRLISCPTIFHQTQPGTASPTDSVDRNKNAFLALSHRPRGRCLSRPCCHISFEEKRAAEAICGPWSSTSSHCALKFLW